MRQAIVAPGVWSSAICYRSDGDKWNYLRQASKALALWPWVPIGNYIAIPDMFTGGRLLPALRHSRSRLAGASHDKLPAINPRKHRGE